MAQFFVSYARIDVVLAEQIIEVLRQRYGHANVWYDQELHNRGGEYWWEEILDAIGKADIFVYLLSKESVESPYCQAEFEEAQRLKKRLIFIQVRDRTPLPETIASRQYADMSKGSGNLKTWTSLYNSIDYQISQIPKRRPRPLKPERTPRPHQSESSQIRPADAPDVDTPTLEVPLAERENVHIDKPWWKKPEFIIGAILIPIIAAVLGAVIQNMGSNNPPQLPPTTEVAQIPTDAPDATQDMGADDARATGAAQAFATLTALAPTATPTITLTPTVTPISSSDIQQTAQAEIFAEATVAAGTQVVIAQETQSAVLTEQFRAGSTATYIAQLSLTPPATHTPTATSSPTSTNTPIATAKPTNTPDPLQAAFTPVTRNADWTPVESDFNGVTMVLVPAGCFVMGSNDGEEDEQPAHEQCFDAPFWIDKYEVTQAQFRRLSGIKTNTPSFSGDNRPVENITWFEARDFCELRDSRLPTEKEWEYAARGPDNLVYPWGNEFVANNAVYGQNSNGQTAVVGSRPGGTAWIGALDMSGNVWEWTSSLYSLFESYPYAAADGREADTGNRTDVLRVLRGGSWYFGTGFLRAALRDGLNPNGRNNADGFRCSRSF